MSQRLKLTVAYDGAPFAGWQSQSHHNTIQDHLERAFKRVAGSAVRVHGAGRTDAGVHATAQCAHVDVNKKLAPARWMAALNALLPPTIRVLQCKSVPKDFHARFSAKGKVYRYRIWSGQVLPPLENERAWHVPFPLDRGLLRSAAAKFVGTHDFAAYAANRRKRKADTIRTIHSIKVRERGSCLTIDIHGNGFLYKMVRLVVGALIKCASGKLPAEEIGKRLCEGRAKGADFAAPAAGLFLIQVRY